MNLCDHNHTNYMAVVTDTAIFNSWASAKINIICNKCQSKSDRIIHINSKLDKQTALLARYNNIDGNDIIDIFSVNENGSQKLLITELF